MKRDIARTSSIPNANLAPFSGNIHHRELQQVPGARHRMNSVDAANLSAPACRISCGPTYFEINANGCCLTVIKGAICESYEQTGLAHTRVAHENELKTEQQRESIE